MAAVSDPDAPAPNAAAPDAMAPDATSGASASPDATPADPADAGAGVHVRPSAGRGALTLMVGTLGSRVTGLFRNSLLNQLFDREITDAFTVALKVPNLFRELLAEGALTNAFVPVYKDLDAADAKRFSGALLAVLVLVNAVLVMLAVLAAPWIVRLLLGAEGSVDAELATQLTRVVFPFLAAISFSAWAMGILQAEERFFAPAWAPVALNVVTIALMLLYPEQAVPLAAAFVLGGVAQFAFQVPFLRRAGVLPRWSGMWHPALGSVLVLMVPFAFTTSGRQFLNVVATRILDALPEGSQTAFYNADLFFSLALGLFSISPALAYYARLADNAANEPEEFRGTLRQGLRFIAFLTAPAGLLLFVFAESAVHIVFNYLGTLDLARLVLSIAATAPLGFAVFPMGLTNLLVRSFYVRREVRTPIVVTVSSLGLQAALYVLLAPVFGIEGLSWATAAVAWLQAAVFLGLVARREGIDVGSFLRFGVLVWLAAGAAVGAGWLAAAAVPVPAGWIGYLLTALIGGGVAVAAYSGLALALRLPEVEAVGRRFGR